jgi:spermidine synthase
MFFNLLADRESILAEMSVHVPFCVHEDPIEALFVTHHPEELQAQALKHSINAAINTGCIDGKKCFDIIVIDEFVNEELLGKAMEALKDKGIVVTRSADGRIKDDLSMLGKYFRIVMPYHHQNFIFASNFYHPTADLILQKSDLLDGLYYYNSEIHIAEFVLPTKMKEHLKKYLKN